MNRTTSTGSAAAPTMSSLPLTASPSITAVIALALGTVAHGAAIAALAGRGCRYVQLDDTNLAYLCDPAMREGAAERGDDPDELPRWG